MTNVMAVMRFTSNKGSRRPLALSEVKLSALGHSECAHLFCFGCGLTGPSSANSSIEINILVLLLSD
jgi:hypothetical protein